MFCRLSKCVREKCCLVKTFYNNLFNCERKAKRFMKSFKKWQCFDFNVVDIIVYYCSVHCACHDLVQLNIIGQSNAKLVCNFFHLP